MPRKTLTDNERRALVLAALAGESPTALARRYGVSRKHVHKLRREALEELDAEYTFWNAAVEAAEERRGEK